MGSESSKGTGAQAPDVPDSSGQVSGPQPDHAEPSSAPSLVSQPDAAVSRRDLVRRLGLTGAVAAAGIVVAAAPAAADPLVRTQPRRFRLAPPPVTADTPASAPVNKGYVDEKLASMSVGSLDDLSDVSAAAPKEGDILVYDGPLGMWVARARFSPISATGGIVSDIIVGGIPYRVHRFTQVGTSTFTVNDPGTLGRVQVLLVGGGGGSGMYSGGGGGGEVVYIPDLAITVGSHQVVVAAGGVGNTANSFATSKNGGQSSFYNQYAKGGGGGKGSDDGSPTGSYSLVANGGGGSSRSVGYSGTLGAFNDGVTGQRFGGRSGGSGSNGTHYPSGGGGGAAGNGASQPSNSGNGAAGGPGVANDILGTMYYWGGGGGGQTYYTASGGPGGIGGGGAGTGRAGGAAGGGSALNPGASTSAQGDGGNGGANTGGGGGGGWGEGSRRGGDGGSGIVVVRYPLTQTG